MKWKDRLIKDIIVLLEESQDTLNIKELILNDKVNIHLAIFSEPYLSLILCGVKTIESRFSINKVIPYGKVFLGDIVLMKKSGGDIVGLFTVSDTIYLSNLTKSKIDEINNIYGKELSWSTDPEFIITKEKSKFLTLIKIDNVIKLNPVSSNKADRMGWSVVKLGYNNTLFENI